MGHEEDPRLITVVFRDKKTREQLFAEQLDLETSIMVRAYAEATGHTIPYVLRRALNEKLPEVLERALAEAKGESV